MNPGDTQVSLTYPQATASDNSGSVVLSYSQESGTAFPVGDTMVAVTAVDPSGNTAGCTFTVTVTGKYFSKIKDLFLKKIGTL